MSIQHCSDVSPTMLDLFLQNIGPQLRELKISHPMRSLNHNSLDEVLLWCPNLEALRVSVELVTPQIFSLVSGQHPLKILDLDGSDTSLVPIMQFTPLLIRKYLKVLASLRSIRVSATLGWTSDWKARKDTEELTDLLAKMDSKNPLGIEPGVWVF